MKYIYIEYDFEYRSYIKIYYHDVAGFCAWTTPDLDDDCAGYSDASDDFDDLYDGSYTDKYLDHYKKHYLPNINKE